jgi:PAS domain S-box-containing protein
MTVLLADPAERGGKFFKQESLLHLGRNCIWDLGSDRVYLSEELLRTYGVGAGSFDGSATSICSLIHPDDRWKRERAMSEALLGNKPEPFEYRIRRPDGTERMVQVKELALHTVPGGRGNYMTGVIQDVTEIRELEEQLTLLSSELERRVHERTAELEQANHRLQELDRLKSMFIAMTSHELRTPLNSIMGFISMTLHGLSGELNEEQKDNLSRAHGSAKHLLSLVTDVIDISKVEAGKTEVYPEDVVLAETVSEAVGGVDPQLRAKSLALKVEVPAELMLFTDRKRLLQCLINLVGNAVKFTEKGEIAVIAKAGEGTVEIAVSDTGIGVRQEDLHRLFQPFERLDSPLRVKTGGTGLGLYLTKKLCTDILKGRITVRSRQGEGSTFTLRIPLDIREGSLQHGE